MEKVPYSGAGVMVGYVCPVIEFASLSPLTVTGLEPLAFSLLIAAAARWVNLLRYRLRLSRLVSTTILHTFILNLSNRFTIGILFSVVGRTFGSWSLKACVGCCVG